MQTLHPPCNQYIFHSNIQQSLNVAIMGLHKVGISSIIRHLENIYRIKQINQKHDIDNNSHQIKVGSLVLNLVECHSEPSSRYVSSEISDIISADIFILVFAVDKIHSFEYVEELKDLILDTKGNGSAIMVVGNKHDVTERQVGFVYTDCVISMDWEMPYVEISTKTGYNLRSILPYLFRHNSLSHYRHLFVNQATRGIESRRRSTGFEKLWPFEVEGHGAYRTTRAKSIALSGNSSPLIATNDTVKQNLKGKKGKKNSLTDNVNNFSLNSIFPCMDKQQQATPEMTQNRLIVTIQNSPDIFRKRCHSLSDKTLESVKRPQLLSNRRYSVGIQQHGHLQQPDGWFRTLKKHLKM